MKTIARILGFVGVILGAYNTIDLATNFNHLLSAGVYNEMELAIQKYSNKKAL